MHRALLIDRNYMALSIISWKKAIKLIVKGKAESIETKTKININGGMNAFSLSTIIRLVVDIPWRAHKSRMKFSRRNIMIRDSHKCQYCEKRLGKSNHTIDHVVPRARGGQTTYTNCVACCRDCNNRKGDRRLEESGMDLKITPKRPGFMVLYKHYLTEYSPEEWADYIIGM